MIHETELFYARARLARAAARLHHTRSSLEFMDVNTLLDIHCVYHEAVERLQKLEEKHHGKIKEVI